MAREFPEFWPVPNTLLDPERFSRIPLPMADESIGRLNEHNFHARAWTRGELLPQRIYSMDRVRTLVGTPFPLTTATPDVLAYYTPGVWIPMLDMSLTNVGYRPSWYQIIGSCQVQVDNALVAPARTNPGALFGIMLNGQIQPDSVVGSLEFQQDAAITKAPALPTAGQENKIIYGYHSPGLMQSSYSILTRCLAFVETTTTAQLAIFLPLNGLDKVEDPVLIGTRELLFMEFNK